VNILENALRIHGKIFNQKNFISKFKKLILWMLVHDERKN